MSTLSPLLVAGIGMTLSVLAAGASALTPAEILHKADESRGNLNGVKWTLLMETKEKNRKTTMQLEVQARGFDVLATTLEPRRSKGDKLLMVRDNMWFHKPGLSKPVPISKRQKLLGDAAYGDIATTNYSGDYEAKITGEEKVGEELCWIFDLKAKHNKTTYDRIKYWISKDRLVGVKAEYITVSGKKFKSANMRYEHQVRVDGKKRPFISELRIRGDLVDRSDTILSLSAPTVGDIPDYIFDLNLLVR